MEFLQEKQYFESDHQLIGFYGTKTVEDYLNTPGGWRAVGKEERQARKEEKAKKKSEALAARMPVVAEEAELERSATAADVSKQGRLNKSFGRVFGKR
jgi:hypothetical protein